MKTTADLPFPESTEAIAYQLHLVKLGLKPCVLIPHYAPFCPVDEKDFVITTTTRGCIVHLPTLSSPRIKRMVLKEPGTLLGYGTTDRPTIGPFWASCIVDKFGNELLSVVVNSSTVDTVDDQLFRYINATSMFSVRHESLPISAIINQRLDYWKKQYNEKELTATQI